MQHYGIIKNGYTKPFIQLPLKCLHTTTRWKKEIWNTIPGIWLVDTLQYVTYRRETLKTYRREYSTQIYIALELEGFIFQSSNFNPQSPTHKNACRSQGAQYFFRFFFLVNGPLYQTTNLFLLYHKEPTKGSEYKRFGKICNGKKDHYLNPAIHPPKNYGLRMCILNSPFFCCSSSSWKECLQSTITHDELEAFHGTGKEAEALKFRYKMYSCVLLQLKMVWDYLIEKWFRRGLLFYTVNKQKWKFDFRSCVFNSSLIVQILVPIRWNDIAGLCVADLFFFIVIRKWERVFDCKIYTRKKSVNEVDDKMSVFFRRMWS